MILHGRRGSLTRRRETLEERCIVGCGGERQVGGDDAQRVRPVVEQEHRVETIGKPGRERDRLGTGKVHHDGAPGRSVVEE